MNHKLKCCTLFSCSVFSKETEHTFVSYPEKFCITIDVCEMI